MIDPRGHRIAKLEALVAQQQAVIAQQQAVIATQQATIARLEARVTDLEARLGQRVGHAEAGGPLTVLRLRASYPSGRPRYSGRSVARLLARG